MSVQERRLEEKEQRRAEIIEAAEAVFAEKGWEAATMGDVAARARLSRALLYFYFTDKEALVFELTRRGLAVLRERFEAAVARHERGVDQLAAIGRAYVTFAETNRLYFDLLTQFESVSLDPAMMSQEQQGCKLEGDKVIAVMVACIQRGLDDGSLRPGLAPFPTAITMWAFTHGLIQVLQAKEKLFEQQGVTRAALLEYGFQLAMLAVSSPPA